LQGSLVLAPGRVEVRVSQRVLSYRDVVGSLTRGHGGLLAGDPSWFAFDALGRASLIVGRSGANPARAEILTDGASTESSSASALSLVEGSHLRMPVALDPDVLDVAAMATAGPADRPGLFPEQDELVSALLATEVGAVLASRPGSGKTVVVASALSEARRRAPSLVAAPAPLLGQWVDELARWAPELRVARARAVGEVTRLLRGADVVVASHQVAARWSEVSRVDVGVLVVDEAVGLLRNSGTSRGLWTLRRRAEVGWALTGAPDETGSRGGVSRLVQWSRVPDLPVADAAAEDFAPVVLGHGSVGPVPLCVPELLAVPPTAVERAALADLKATPVAAARGLARVQEGHRRRRLLASPTGVCGEVVSSKVEAVAEMVSDLVAGGSRALLFAAGTDLLEEYVERLRREVDAEVLPGPKERSRRVRVLSAFADGSLPVLGVSPASQRGVNLQHADVVVHLDLPWSSGEFDQRNGRAARIGSDHERVRVVLPCLAGTIDADMAQAFATGSRVEDLGDLLLAAGADTP
jgi:hypothetical protein